MSQVGTVLALAVRGPNTGPMRELEWAEATADGGLGGDVRSSPERGITLLSAEQWADVMRELGVELPWHTRRANVLVSGGGLGALVGRRLRIGAAEIEVLGETRPCALMDRLQPGLRAALAPACRGGVHARIVQGGGLRVGDPVELVSA